MLNASSMFLPNLKYHIILVKLSCHDHSHVHLMEWYVRVTRTRCVGANAVISFMHFRNLDVIMCKQLVRQQHV